MKLRLLRFFARHPLALLGTGAALALAAATAITVAASSAGPPSPAPAAHPAADRGAQTDPRQILGRGWFDSYPEKRTDVIKLYFFGGGGFGIYEDGSSYRYAIDVFDLERQNDKLSIKFLQDGKTAETKFTITACDDKPPFDLCLDLAHPPRGPKRYYSFNYEEDAARYPWAADRLRAAAAALVP